MEDLLSSRRPEPLWPVVTILIGLQTGCRAGRFAGPIIDLTPPSSAGSAGERIIRVMLDLQCLKGLALIHGSLRSPRAGGSLNCLPEPSRSGCACSATPMAGRARGPATLHHNQTVQMSTISVVAPILTRPRRTAACRPERASSRRICRASPRAAPANRTLQRSGRPGAADGSGAAPQQG